MAGLDSRHCFFTKWWNPEKWITAIVSTKWRFRKAHSQRRWLSNLSSWEERKKLPWRKQCFLTPCFVRGTLKGRRAIKSFAKKGYSHANRFAKLSLNTLEHFDGHLSLILYKDLLIDPHSLIVKQWNIHASCCVTPSTFKCFEQQEAAAHRLSSLVQSLKKKS